MVVVIVTIIVITTVLKNLKSSRDNETSTQLTVV